MKTQRIVRRCLRSCCSTHAVRKDALTFARVITDSFDARRQKRRGIEAAIGELGTQCIESGQHDQAGS
jgi:hypothetical protein